MYKKLIAVFTLAFASITFSQTEILNENFESGFPINWELIDVDQQIPNAAVSEYTSAWIVKPDPADTSNQTISSTSFYNIVGQANKWLITPQITLGAYGNYLKFKAKSFDPSYPDNYKILISIGNLITDFQDTVALVIQETPYWIDREFLLDSSFNGQAIFIAFVNTTNDGHSLYLDDIIVRKDDPLNVDKQTMVSIQISPNPTSQYLNISSEKAVTAYQIVSTDGKLVQKAKLENVQQVDVSLLEEGVYFIRLNVNNQWTNQKFIKK
jgi:hypothetical protein